MIAISLDRARKLCSDQCRKLALITLLLLLCDDGPLSGDGVSTGFKILTCLFLVINQNSSNTLKINVCFLFFTVL